MGASKLKNQLRERRGRGRERERVKIYINYISLFLSLYFSQNLPAGCCICYWSRWNEWVSVNSSLLNQSVNSCLSVACFSHEMLDAFCGHLSRAGYKWPLGHRWDKEEAPANTYFAFSLIRWEEELCSLSLSLFLTLTRTHRHRIKKQSMRPLTVLI